MLGIPKVEAKMMVVWKSHDQILALKDAGFVERCFTVHLSNLPYLLSSSFHIALSYSLT